MKFKRNNGGNPKGINDCVARSLAIFLQIPYYDVAQALAPIMSDKGINAWSAELIDYMEGHGLRYVPAHQVPRFVANIPGNCIVHTLNHFTTVVDDTVQDTIDTRMETVRGYWVRGLRFSVVKDGVNKNSAPMNFTQAVAMRRMLAMNYNTYTEIQSL